jgi:uncharacterized protein (TIGR02284 family)
LQVFCRTRDPLQVFIPPSEPDSQQGGCELKDTAVEYGCRLSGSAIAPFVKRRRTHMNNNEVISILNKLIETCRKGQKVFRSAAEGVQNNEFRRLFNIFAQQRAQFITELQAELHRLGGEVSVETTPPSGKTIPFPSSGMRDEAAVITECQREEEAAVNEYQEALRADLQLDVQYVIKRQYMDIKDAYDRIRILQRAA